MHIMMVIWVVPNFELLNKATIDLPVPVFFLLVVICLLFSWWISVLAFLGYMGMNGISGL